MMDAAQVGSLVVWSTLAGGMGALGMFGMLRAFNRSGLANVRLIVAIGSLVTRSHENAVWAGACVHALAGILFGQIFGFLLFQIHQPGVAANMLWGAAMGFLHGLIVSLVIISAVSEVHPLPEFRQRGFTIVVAYAVAHVFYGAIVGTVIGLSGIIVPQ